MITYTNSARNFQGGGEPEQVATIAAERGLFGLLGVAPILGRTFGEGDLLNVAVASYVFWRGSLGGSLGHRAQHHTRWTTVHADRCHAGGVSVPVHILFQGSVGSLGGAGGTPQPSHRRLDAVVARLKEGIGMEAARQELNAMESTIQGGRIVRIRPLKDVVSGAARESLLVLFGATGMVLLVACLNVANLLLARTAARAREIAIRAAVGAGRRRLMRQFLTESLVLALRRHRGPRRSECWAAACSCALPPPRSREPRKSAWTGASSPSSCGLHGHRHRLRSRARHRGLARTRRRTRAPQRRARLFATPSWSRKSLSLSSCSPARDCCFVPSSTADISPGLHPENVLTMHLVIARRPGIDGDRAAHLADPRRARRRYDFAPAASGLRLERRIHHRRTPRSTRNRIAIRDPRIFSRDGHPAPPRPRVLPPRRPLRPAASS